MVIFGGLIAENQRGVADHLRFNDLRRGGLNFVQEIHRVDGSQLVPEIVGSDLVQLLLDNDARVVVVIADDRRLRGWGQVHSATG